MELKKISELVKKIQVKNQVNGDVEVSNSSPLTLIGKGRQGAVFRVTDDMCVKVYGNEEDCKREYYALSLGQKTGIVPHVYGRGTNYIVLEHVAGVDLREYLQSQPLTEELSRKLIEMLVTFKQIGFERIDHHKRQIYVQADGNLKVIDVGRTVWRDRVYPYPRKLLTSLGDKHRAVFLSHVQLMAPELYEEWQYYIQLEQLAHEIYRKFMLTPADRDIKDLSRSLLKNTGKTGIQKIEDLLHNVFKEEWDRAMNRGITSPAARDVEAKLKNRGGTEARGDEARED